MTNAIRNAHYGGLSSSELLYYMGSCMYTVPYRRRYQYAKASKEELTKQKYFLHLQELSSSFVSSLKIPSVTGSCSHPTGTGLGAILFGPSIMSLLGIIVLLFQALLLAHGGLTTLWCKHIFNGDCRTIRFIRYIQVMPKA